MPEEAAATYLEPYVRAARQWGAGFQALLWASTKTQRARFEAIRRIHPLAGKSVLDAGCGRADLMAYLLDRGTPPADYVGLEAVETLAAAAESRHYPDTRIVRGDFVRDPARLFVGADVIVFSGSLNTMAGDLFYGTLRRAYDATAEAVVFNFLASPGLAGKDFLVWHRRQDVMSFAHDTADAVLALADYLPGDCTVAMIKHA
jgi:SAM-dependent methyltransferase